MSDVMDHVLDGVDEVEVHGAAPASQELRALLCGRGGNDVVGDDALRYGWTHFIRVGGCWIEKVLLLIMPQMFRQFSCC